ncbi:MAG: hypothetical protein V1794_03575 [Candidatus Glassbacteria bacterium]
MRRRESIRTILAAIAAVSSLWGTVAGAAPEAEGFRYGWKAKGGGQS